MINNFCVNSIRFVRKIKKIFLFLYFFVESVDASYYCPRTNVWLEQQTPSLNERGIVSAKSNGINEPFPLHERDIGKEPNIGKIYFDVKNCATKEFLCLQFQQHQTQQVRKSFYLFLPRKIEADKEYFFGDMWVVTQLPMSFHMQDNKRKKQILQAILWQKIDGVQTPIKLEIEEGRGITLWDGLDFWSGKFGGEICNIQSSVGFFSEVKIKVRAN